MGAVIGGPFRVEINGVDLSSFVTDAGIEVTPWQSSILEALPDVNVPLGGYWDAGLRGWSTSFSVPFCALHPKTRRLLLGLMYDARRRRLSRMRTAYRSRKRQR